MTTTTSLGSHVEFRKGYAFKSGWYSDEGHPIVKVSDFTDSSVDSANLVFIPREIAEKFLKYELETDDVVIQTVGSWPSNPDSVVGKVIRIPSEVSGALLNQNAVKLIPSAAVDRRFLFYRLKCSDFRSYIVGTAQGAASQAAVTLGSIAAFEFLLPDHDTQVGIAGFLSQYDNLIENNIRRIKILEQMSQMIYREWFVNLRFPGYEKVEITKPEIGKIPGGWKPSCIGDIATELRNSISPTDVPSDTPYVGLEHIPRKSIALTVWGKVDEVQSTKLRFDRGDILFGKIRPYFHKVVAAPIAGVCSSDAIVIVPRSPEFFALALCCISSDDFVAHATQTSQGTKMPRANWDVLTRYPLLLPENPTLSRFNDIVQPMIELINSLIFRNRNLRQSRDLLLPKLISGEISVEAAEREAAAQGA